MITQAIISEYNPFHNGHLYQLKKAAVLTSANYTISLMGGNFLQRGTAAMWDKYTRAKMSLLSGIDLSLELPFPYATGSARDFALGAVSILNNLNCVDFLCFGAECSELKILSDIANVLSCEPAEYSECFKKYILQGFAYPAAQTRALIDYMGDSSVDRIVSLPNNTLAIEYLVALNRTDSKIKPVLIQRTNSYHEISLQGNISSATAIRNAIYNASEAFPDYSIIKDEVPACTMDIINQSQNMSSPITSDLLTPFIQGSLLTENYYDDICDLDEDLCNRINKAQINQSLSELVASLKSKNYTETRIRRALVHLLLKYTESDRSRFIHDGYAYYANILGFRKNSSELIHKLKYSSSIPLITKKADAAKLFISSDNNRHSGADRMWELDTKATALYNCLIRNRYNTNMPNDFTIQFPIV